MIKVFAPEASLLGVCTAVSAYALSLPPLPANVSLMALSLLPATPVQKD